MPDLREGIRRTAAAEILECPALLAEGSRISGAGRVKGHEEDAVAGWPLEAAGHAELVGNALLSEFRISRGQPDGLRSCVKNEGGKKGHPETEESGQPFRPAMTDMDSRLRAARGFGKTGAEASAAVFRQLKGRSYSDGLPPAVSDGRGGIREAMAEACGKAPEHSGKGRPPSKKRPQPGWNCAQTVKRRDEKGNFLGAQFRAAYGDPEKPAEISGQSAAVWP